MEPIWKDHIVTLANSAIVGGVEYRVKQNGAVLYQGRAFARPGANEITAKINDIIADHISASWGGWTASGGTPALDSLLPYIVEVYDDNFDTWTQVDSETFLPDWSYDPSYDPAVDGYNFPVLMQASPLQLIPVIVPPAGAAVTVKKKDGTTVALSWAGDIDEYQQDWIDLTDYPTAVELLTSYGNVAVGACVTFVLYYINAYGYWDWLPVTAKTDETDNLTRQTREIVYDNGQTYNRATWNYSNELKHQYTLRTSYLPEKESLRMQHLLNSPTVYLHDLEAGAIRPIVLTGSKTEYKSGPRLYQYTITADLAQDRIRR